MNRGSSLVTKLMGGCGDYDLLRQKTAELRYFLFFPEVSGSSLCCDFDIDYWESKFKAENRAEAENLNPNYE